MRGRFFLCVALLVLPVSAAVPASAVIRPATGSAKKGPKTELYVAAKKCHVAGNLSDRNKTLSLDTQGQEEISGDTYDEVICVFNKLKVPSYIRQQVSNTRALDGMQHAHWRSYKASWTYHPDEGLNMVIYKP